MAQQSEFRALVADDDESFRAVLCELLAPFFDLVEATNGAEAVEIASAEPVHIAVFDWQMPSLNGLEAVQELRQRRLEFPCLLVTASEPDELELAAAAAAIFTVLRKPIRRQTLLNRLADAVRSSYTDESLSARLAAG
jgi:CheY-like chemotaxis protein